MEKESIIAEDPRGIPVACDESALDWILRLKHPELKNRIKRTHVIATISSPNHGIIYVSNHKADRYIYYKNFKEFEPEVMIVVAFSDPKIGVITSIHFVSVRAPGERIVWPPKLAQVPN